MGNGTSQGVFIHELGHALSLPHWANDPSYPYNGAQFGISPPSGNNWHAGPTWAFDLERRLEETELARRYGGRLGVIARTSVMKLSPRSAAMGWA